MWKEATEITVVCVLAIQMGLVDAIGKLMHYEFRILSCPKCCVLWASLGWHLLHSRPFLDSVFVAFLSSYAALWLAMLYDAIAIIYNNVYEQIKPEAADTAETESSPDAVSELQQ